MQLSSDSLSLLRDSHENDIEINSDACSYLESKYSIDCKTLGIKRNNRSHR